MSKKLTFLLIGIVELIAVLLCIVIPALFNNGIFLCSHPLFEAKDGQIRVACVGDSITYGHGVKEWTKNAYPFKLGEMLGDEYCVNNYGYSDRTLLSTGNKPYRDEKLYKQSLNFNPDIVVIMLGTNDTKSMNWKDQETYEKEYTEMINSYKNLESNPTIYMMAPPRTKDAAKLQNDIVKNEVYNGVKNVAEQTGSIFIDLYDVFEGTSGLYYFDGIHPNYKGAQLIAETVYEFIK